MRYCLFGLHQPLSNDLGVCRARSTNQPGKLPAKNNDLGKDSSLTLRMLLMGMSVKVPSGATAAAGTAPGAAACREHSISARNPPEQLQFSAPVRAAALSTSPAAPRLLLTPKLITECRMEWFSSTTLRCVAVMLPVLLWHLHQLRGNTNHGNEHFWGSSDRLGFAKPGFPSDPPSSAMLGQLGLGDLSL